VNGRVKGMLSTRKHPAIHRLYRDFASMNPSHPQPRHTDHLASQDRKSYRLRRIVCLVPSITETLFAFGAGPGVVGITDYCVHPLQEVQAKTKIGGTKNLAVEKIVSLDPDLVIANAEENRKHQIEKLRAAGVKVFVTFPRTVGECLKMMGDVAALTGTEEAAAPLLHSIDQARKEARISAPLSPPARHIP